MQLSLAYSTDLDDAFMFWPLATGRMSPRDHGFDGTEHVRSDTATLNRWARDGVYDVVAVSIAAVPSLSHNWLLLPAMPAPMTEPQPMPMDRRSARDSSTTCPSELCCTVTCPA